VMRRMISISDGLPVSRSDTPYGDDSQIRSEGTRRRCMNDPHAATRRRCWR
jgi:hypothetical protein